MGWFFHNLKGSLGRATAPTAQDLSVRLHVNAQQANNYIEQRLYVRYDTDVHTASDRSAHVDFDFDHTY